LLDLVFAAMGLNEFAFVHGFGGPPFSESSSKFSWLTQLMSRAWEYPVLNLVHGFKPQPVLQSNGRKIGKKKQ
jgi:hypothetical protein